MFVEIIDRCCSRWKFITCMLLVPLFVTAALHGVCWKLVSWADVLFMDL